MSAHCDEASREDLERHMQERQRQGNGSAEIPKSGMPQEQINFGDSGPLKKARTWAHLQPAKRLAFISTLKSSDGGSSRTSAEESLIIGQPGVKMDLLASQTGVAVAKPKALSPPPLKTGASGLPAQKVKSCGTAPKINYGDALDSAIEAARTEIAAAASNTVLKQDQGRPAMRSVPAIASIARTATSKSNVAVEVSRIASQAKPKQPGRARPTRASMAVAAALEQLRALSELFTEHSRQKEQARRRIMNQKDCGSQSADESSGDESVTWEQEWPSMDLRWQESMPILHV